MNWSTVCRIRSLAAALVGMRYRDLSGFDPGHRQAIEDTLAELHAEKCGESGSPAFEINNEYFRIGRRKIRVCTEDEMDVSLWGSKKLVDQVYTKIVEKLKARGCAGLNR
jgi:hypothetical protein